MLVADVRHIQTLHWSQRSSNRKEVADAMHGLGNSCMYCCSIVLLLGLCFGLERLAVEIGLMSSMNLR